MNLDIFSLSPFCSPRKKKAPYRKHAILLIEEKNETPETKRALSARVSRLAEELLPTTQLPTEESEDIMTQVGEILKSRIKSHSGQDVELLTPEEVIKKNSPALVPLMYRVSTEDFARSSRSMFKIIECRNSTKLVSDWKPTLADMLVALKHQVIIVHLQKSFLPYNDFVYAVLRQLEREWLIRLPRSFFFPNDVCTVKKIKENDLIVVTPSMPDGDLEISRKMSTLNYELIMMFKRSCMSALKNYLLMRDLRVGRFQDTVDAVTAIRSIYKKLQNRLKEGEEIRLGSGESNEDLHSFLRQTMSSNPVTAEDLMQYGEKLGIDNENAYNKRADGDRSEIANEVYESCSKNVQMDKRSLKYLELDLQSGKLSARGSILNTDYSVLDLKLCADFERIRLLITGEDDDKIESEAILKCDPKNLKVKMKEKGEKNTV